MSSVFIIAEAGVNHNGDYGLAFELVDSAVSAGADAIKFQTFISEDVVTKSANKAVYQESTTSSSETQFDMIKKLELPYEWHFDLLRYCNKKGIKFLSTAFDKKSLDFLVDEIKIDVIKIPSGEITNAPFLLECAKKGKNLIVSTGMADMHEIEQALGIIAFGLLNNLNLKDKYSMSDFEQAYHSLEGKKILQTNVTLLHCTTEYPAPIEDINLNAMASMRNTFGVDIGYSDHSKGITVPIVATALGATIIEKHFTIDKNLLGPDHKASLDPKELENMINEIRLVEKMMGNGLKIPMLSEINNKNVARRSLVATKKIIKGEIFTVDNLTAKRPGDGISPMLYWEYLGKKSNNNYQPDDLISSDK
jgi:N-acetylneuraminate synthase